MLLRPRSNGYIRLRSDSPYDKPIIIPNYLVDDQDVKVLVEGVKIGLALAETQVKNLTMGDLLGQSQVNFFMYLPQELSFLEETVSHYSLIEIYYTTEF